MRRIAGRIAAATIPVLLGTAASVAAAQVTPVVVPASRAVPDSIRMAAITYIAGQAVYVGAGRSDGLHEGMSLDVVRSGRVIATLQAAFLSSHSASCDIVSTTAPPAVGDSVRYRVSVEQAMVAGVDSTTPREISSGSSASSLWRRAFHGHLGLRYLRIDQPAIGGGFSQPSADVHIEGTRIGGTPVGFVIDGRSRRTIGGNRGGADDERMRVYEGSTSFTHEGSGTRLSVGRQYSAALAPVSLFDGVTLELNRPHWAIGGFSGLQPDVTTMGFSTTIREAGGYLQLHSAPGGSMPWSFTTGGVESRQLGELNREFGFAQVLLSSGVFTLYATQEVDVNRGWKLTVGEPAVSPTSTFATAQLRLVDWFVLNGGVDNRRNVRLYRDFVSPETEFDDTFREGAWGGATLTLFRHLRLSGDARASRGGIGGRADYYTGSVGLDPVSPARIEARLRSTSFSTENSTGWLHAGSAGVQPFSFVRLEVNGGLRTQQRVAQPADTTSLAPPVPLADSRWLGFSMDLTLTRSWYVLLSGTRDGSGIERTDQLYGSLVFRF